MERDLEQYIKDSFQRALDYHYLRPYYQPVIRTASRKLCSFEVLARWLDPELGMIYPNEFIPVLEEAGEIHRLDEHIIRQACLRLRMRISAGEIPVPISVNLSRRDFELCDIFAVVDGIVSEYHLPHDFVYIEITESVMAEQKDMLLSVVDRFRSAGYRVWMDDFGSAYSSLNVLKDFDFDELKLDMEFLRPFSPRSQKIATAVIEMAKGLYTHTLAEGVENEDQFRYLRNIGCEKVQGYYFGRPMPYEEALAHIAENGIEIERPQDRKYYDEIGKVNYLSAVPFMTREERESITTARQLNSIPLAIAEVHRDHFSILFYNTAFEETALETGMFANIFKQELLRQPQPFDKLSERVRNLMDSTRGGGDGSMQFTSHEDYFEVRAKCIAETEDKYSVLMRLSNLSKAAKTSDTSVLDDSLRRIYAMYERITLVDIANDTAKPLYVATKKELVSGRSGLAGMAREYADKYLHPDDRRAYLEMMEPETVEERFKARSYTYMTRVLRTLSGHGDYVWKEYTLLRLEEKIYAILIRKVQSSVLMLEETLRLNGDDNVVFSAQSIWHNLLNSGLIRMFWKDRDRRFIGVNRAFLDYFGFDSADDIIGKTDEEVGWHIHPDQFVSDDIRILHEGITVHNVPGRCLCRGENREILSSKAPLYDENGRIQGLVGYFIDSELLTENDVRGDETKRRDILTGLLNSRGIAEEAVKYRDEYFLRKKDFVRFFIELDDFGSINEQYGYDFGDKVIVAFAEALNREFGRSCALARSAGISFIMIKQISNIREAHDLRERIRKAGATVNEVAGIPITIYSSAGYALFSESEDLTEQETRSERRLLADQNQGVTGEIVMSHAAELFRLFDDLPIGYAVYHITRNEERDAVDAVLFYVNHKYEEYARIKSEETIGRGVRELYPFMDADVTWYNDLIAAALNNERTEGVFTFGLTGVSFRYTARQVIYEGYCAVTYQELQP